MSESSSLFVRQNEELPYCPRELYLEDSSDSDSEVDDPNQNISVKQPAPEVVEDDSDDDTIYCVCRKIARGFMVGCDGGCDDWFHGTCVGIKAKQKDLLKQFVCPNCTKDGRGAITWKGITGNKAEEEDQFVPDTDEDELSDAVFGSNSLLKQNVPAHKPASQPVHLAAAAREKHVGKSRLRAQPAPKQKASAPPTFAAAKFVPIAQKLKYSLPTFAPTPPGYRAQSQGHDNVDDHGADDGNGDVCGRRTRRAAKPDISLTAGTHEVGIQRRTYVDVDEAPTYSDVLVKKSLETALFGAQDN